MVWKDKISQPLQTGFARAPARQLGALGLGPFGALAYSRRGGPRQLPGAAPAGALQFVSLLRHPSLLDLLLGAEVPGADLDQSQPLRHEADAGELRGTSALLSALLTVTAPAQLAGMVPSGRDDEPWAQGKRRVKAWRGAAKVRGSGGGLREIQAGGGCASFFGAVGASSLVVGGGRVGLLLQLGRGHGREAPPLHV